VIIRQKDQLLYSIAAIKCGTIKRWVATYYQHSVRRQFQGGSGSWPGSISRYTVLQLDKRNRNRPRHLPFTTRHPSQPRSPASVLADRPETISCLLLILIFNLTGTKNAQQIMYFFMQKGAQLIVLKSLTTLYSDQLSW